MCACCEPSCPREEIDFWGVHKFLDSSYGMGCTLCGWGYHAPVHHECPTCGPTTTEMHPRVEGVVRCGNCMEHLETIR